MGKTVIETMKSTINKYPDEKAISFKKNNIWHFLTWKNYFDTISLLAKGMISCGLEENSYVTILSQNRYEWVIADLASIYAWSIPAGIYPSSSSEQCKYIMNHFI